MKLAARVARISLNNAFDEIERLRCTGIPFINFAWGDPDQPTHRAIKAAASTALDQDKTRYADVSGIYELRQAIADFITRTRKVSVSWEEVIILPGANPGVFLSLLALIDEGDEVIYPNPGFPIYESAIKVVGGKPVPLPLYHHLGYIFDFRELKKLISPRTRAIIVNSPGNPAGSLFGAEHLDRIAEVAVDRDLWILSDEVYYDFVYEGQFQSLFSHPELRQRVLLIDSFSKTYSMTGWRLGYAVGPRSLIERLGVLFAQTDVCVNTFIQYAGIEALRKHDEIAAERQAIYRQRRDLMVAGLNAIPGIKCPVPAGSIYVFPEVTEACRRLGIKGARAFQNLLAEKCRIAVMARDWFGPCNPGETGEFIRFSYTLPLAEIEEGLRRIQMLMKSS